MCTCNLPFLNVGAVIFQRHSVGQTKHDVGWVWPMAHQFMAFAVKNNFVISIGVCVWGGGGAAGRRWGEDGELYGLWGSGGSLVNSIPFSEFWTNWKIETKEWAAGGQIITFLTEF